MKRLAISFSIVALMALAGCENKMERLRAANELFATEAPRLQDLQKRTTEAKKTAILSAFLEQAPDDAVKDVQIAVEVDDDSIKIANLTSDLDPPVGLFALHFRQLTSLAADFNRQLADKTSETSRRIRAKYADLEERLEKQRDLVKTIEDERDAARSAL